MTEDNSLQSDEIYADCLAFTRKLERAYYHFVAVDMTEELSADERKVAEQNAIGMQGTTLVKACDYQVIDSGDFRGALMGLSEFYRQHVDDAALCDRFDRVADLHAAVFGHIERLPQEDKTLDNLLSLYSDSAKVQGQALLDKFSSVLETEVTAVELCHDLNDLDKGLLTQLTTAFKIVALGKPAKMQLITGIQQRCGLVPSEDYLQDLEDIAAHYEDYGVTPASETVQKSLEQYVFTQRQYERELALDEPDNRLG